MKYLARSGSSSSLIFLPSTESFSRISSAGTVPESAL
jgi:hypothetical protein